LNTLREQIGDIPESFLLEDEAAEGPFYFDCTRFDINRFLDVFDRIKLTDEYVLDYFYEANGSGGFPIPFTRKENSDPMPLLREILRKKKESRELLGYPILIKQMIKDVEFEKSASGYFQFVLFDKAVCQFYLFWHAGYNDSDFVLSKSQLEKLLTDIPEKNETQTFHNKRAMIKELPKFTISREERCILKNIALNPRVRMMDQSAKVTMVAFTKWGGFYYDHTHVKWPNAVEKKERDIIVEYDCGVLF
jgi:hypothetical protein